MTETVYVSAAGLALVARGEYRYIMAERFPSTLGLFGLLHWRHNHR